MTRQPTDTEVRAALERIVASPGFVRTSRVRDFLRFVIEETLAGRAAGVTGHSIALNVFRKPADFDAANDPLVRVQAARLRSRLGEYYADVGASDAVRIEMKPGSYVPTFRLAAASRPAPALPPPAVAQRPATSRRRWLIGVPAAVLIAAAVAVAGIALWSSTRDGGESYNEPAAVAAPQTALRILVEPFRAVETPETANLAFGITEEIVIRLGAYRDLQILVAPVAGDGPEPKRDREDAARADYVLAGSVSTANDTIRVAPRLVDARSGQQVWTTTYDEPLAADSVWRVVDSVADAVAASVGEPYGPLFDAEVARNAALETSSDPYHCLLRFVFALQVISEGAHGRATACFERVVATEPDSSMSWARLAALYRMEYLHGFNVKAGAPAALDRATEAARRALELDANNAFAHQELAFLCLLRDDLAGFEESVARALALKPSADIRAALGINFVKMGEVERGFALIDEGIADSPRAPPFFFLGYVVHALRMNDYDAAYEWAQRMATRDWPMSQAVLAAVAALAGEPDRAHEAAKRLRELRPAFATTGRELIARGRLGREVESQLARGLALAGVTLN